MEYSRKLKSFRGFFTALSSTADSIGMILSGKGLFRFIMIPFFVNIVLLVLLCAAALGFVYPFLSSLLPAGDIWYLTALRFVVKPLFVLALAGLVFLCYSIIGSLAAVPFADAIVRRMTESSGVKIGGSAVRSIVYGLESVLLFICVEAAISLCNIIPAAGNLLYLILTAFFLLFFLGSQVYDVVAGGSHRSFSERLKDYWSMKWLMCGLGLSFLVLSAIPLLGFLSPVICSASAAQIYCRLTVAE